MPCTSPIDARRDDGTDLIKDTDGQMITVDGHSSCRTTQPETCGRGGHPEMMDHHGRAFRDRVIGQEALHRIPTPANPGSDDPTCRDREPSRVIGVDPGPAGRENREQGGIHEDTPANDAGRTFPGRDPAIRPVERPVIEGRPGESRGHGDPCDGHDQPGLATAIQIVPLKSASIHRSTRVA